jgi:hypothetical protein
MTMKADQYTHDLHGNEVDGWYWQLTEEQFRSDRLRSSTSEPRKRSGLAFPRRSCCGPTR